jgi:transcriptional regulator
MYVPAHFEETRLEVLHEGGAQPSSGSSGHAGQRRPQRESHPIELDLEPLPLGTLRGHVSRANQCGRTSPACGALVIFRAEIYITPSWYQPSKSPEGRALGTTPLFMRAANCAY